MDNIKSKIEKILAKARSTDNEAEAAIFLAKAEALMEEHQIGLLDLGSDDPMGKGIGMSGTPSSPTWQRHLMNQLATYYGARTVRCRVYRNGREEFDLYVCGPESARVTTELMYPFVIEQIRKEGRAAAGAMGMKPEAAIRRVANALTHSLARMQAEKAKEKPKTQAAAKNALVKVDALTAYMEAAWPHLVAGHGRPVSINAVAKSAASRVSLHRQAGGSAAKQIGRS